MARAADPGVISPSCEAGREPRPVEPGRTHRAGRRASVGCALCAALLGAALAGTSKAAGAAPEPHNTFDIAEFRVLGAHTLPVRDVERAVYPFLGPKRDLETVEKARAALEKAYRDAGYGAVFVDIPEQTVDEGLVRLKVTEGVLEHVRVHGARYFSGREIRAALPALVDGQTPHLPTLQEQLAELNAQTADRTVTPVLKAGSVPGTVDVDLAVKDTLPLHGSLEGDNRHTADTTPNRLTASMSYDNLWQRRDSLSVQYQTAPAHTEDATVELASYLLHIGDSGGAELFSFTHTSSNVLALDTLGVLGKGTIYGTRWQQAVWSTAAVSSDWSFGVDYKDVLTLVFPTPGPSGGAASPVSAPIHYLNWSAAYDQAWRQPRYSLATTVSLNFGVRGLVNTSDEFENARAGGVPDYFYLRLTGQAMYRLPAGFALTARLAGQWSQDPLVNNEQFALGGEDTVRGYFEAETLGDSGLAGGLELHSPQLGALAPRMLSPLYMYVFVDAGVATLLEPLSTQNYNLHLWSTGVGLRLQSIAGLSGWVDYALPEMNGVRTQKHQGRVDFSVRYGF